MRALVLRRAFALRAIAILSSMALPAGCSLPVGGLGNATTARPQVGADGHARGVANVGHRGASGHAPEHTLLAYDRAIDMGADYIEQDIRMTSDGVLVVLHDATLDRTAHGPAENCTGPVIEKTLAQLATCDVGRWFNLRYPASRRAEYLGLRIPTLDEVLRRYGRRVNYYIETKDPESAPGMEQALVRLLDQHDLRTVAAERGLVLIQSFSTTSLRTLHALDPALPLVQLLPASMSSSAIRMALDGLQALAIGIGPAKGSVDQALVDDAHERCLVVHPYTVNDVSEMQALLALGVDGMFTNFPDRLAAQLRRGGEPARPVTTHVTGLRCGR